MRKLATSRPRRVLVLVCLFTWATYSAARAQFQLDIEQVASQAFPNLEDEDAAAANDQLRETKRGPFFDIEQNLDAFIFNQYQDRDGAKRFLNRQLTAAIASMDRDCQLSTAQREKLRLAGQGDVVRFFSELEQIRAEFRGQHDVNKINEVFQRIQPLRQKMQHDIFGQDSMLQKVRANTLDEEQLKRHQVNEKSRLEFAYRAEVKLAVVGIERSCPLRAAQRTQVMELLNKTQPPNTQGNLTRFYVLYQLSEIKDQLDDVLDAGQLKALLRVADQGRAYAQLLRQQGYID